jgi:hypothetical protein
MKQSEVKYSMMGGTFEDALTQALGHQKTIIIR